MLKTRGERSWAGRVALVLVALLVVLSPAGGAAQEREIPGPGDLRVYLLTFGPGAAIWERFGHNALWIHDPGAGTDVAYHYGLFDMSESGFLLHFLQGRMLYSMGEAPALALIDYYRQHGRPATVQELWLTQPQARELQRFLQWNMRPENRVYRYDYFRDNCSTRIRDALDRVLDGALREALDTRTTDITYRSEALRLTAQDRLLTLGLDLGLGPLADQRLTEWDLGFIPMRLRDAIRELTVQHDDLRLPLVAGEQGLPPVTEPDRERAAPAGVVSARVVWMLLVGLAAGAILFLSGRIATRPTTAPPRAATAARWGLALAGSLWGLVTGVVGVILLALWLFTDHEFAHANENLLQANPLGLALVVLVPLAVARARRTDDAGPDGARVTRAAFLVAAGLAALSALGLLIRPLPITPQATLGVVAVALPIHIGLALALHAAYRQAHQRLHGTAAGRTLRP